MLISGLVGCCAIPQAVFEGMLPLYHYVYVTAFQIV